MDDSDSSNNNPNNNTNTDTQNPTSIQKKKEGLLLRKSRSGCQDCRVRRVKCDEVKPVCSNCRRRYVGIETCNWTRAPNRRARKPRNATPLHPASDEGERSPSPSSSSSNSVHTSSSTRAGVPASLTNHPTSLTTTGPWRVLELRLMYHYTSVVCDTVPDCINAPIGTFRKIIPQLSFESELVLNPMLAFSAIHLHAHSPNNSAVAIAIRRYLDRSLVDHRQALVADPAGRLSEQLWISALLVSHVHWLLAHQRQPDEPYELPLQPWRMLLSIGTLFEQKETLLRQLGYRWFGRDAVPHTSPERSLSAEAQAQIQCLRRDLDYLLETFGFAGLPENDQRVYLEVKEYVLHHYRAFFSGASPSSLWRFVAFMVIQCDARYHEMLERHDPLAMALMARITVLLRYLEPPWWLGGMGEYEVAERDVRGIRELLPEELKWAMDWPCRVLDGEVVISRPEVEIDPLLLIT